MDDDGNVMVVWTQGNSTFMGVYANHFSAGAWGEAVFIGNSSGKAYGAQVAVDDNGNAVAVWDQTGGANVNITAIRYSAGAWGTATVIGKGTRLSNPQVAMDDIGNAVAVWNQPDGAILNIYANQFLEGAWGPAMVIGNSAGYSNTQVAMDDNGNEVAVWQKTNGANYSIYANRYSAGSWGTETLIWDGAGDGHLSAMVAMDNNGNAVVSWYQCDGADNNIYADRYSAGAWGTATLIETSTGRHDMITVTPQVAMDDNGSAVVVWNRYHIRGSNILADFYSVVNVDVNTTSPATVPSNHGTTNLILVLMVIILAISAIVLVIRRKGRKVR